MIGLSQPTCSRIETGARPLEGAELLMLADRFRVRAGTITGVATMRERVRSAAGTGGAQPPMAAMRGKLHAYLELNAHLSDQGVDPAWMPGAEPDGYGTGGAGPSGSGPRRAPYVTAAGLTFERFDALPSMAVPIPLPAGRHR